MSLTETYKAFADDSRLRIINALRFGVFNVQELTSVLRLSQPTVSHHLKILTQSGVVSSEKAGTWAYYRLRGDEKANAAAFTISQAFLNLTETSPSLVPALSNDNQEIKQVLERRRDDAKVFFDSAAKNWKDLSREIQGPESFIEELAREIPSTASLLELGCGTGTLLEKILPRSGKTYGVDYSEAMLETAKRTLGTRSSGVDLRLGYLEHLPLGDDSVECAVAHMVLHHIADPKEVLRDASRVLKQGGTLKVVELTTHAREEMRERYADLWLGFDVQELSRWTEEAGFTGIEARFLDKGKNVFLLSAVKL